MRGRSIALSRSRRLVIDMMHFAQGVPSIPVQRRMQLGPLLAARTGSTERPGWAALFTKAFARVASEVPELRRAYCKFPWPHLCEYPVSVGSVAIERDHDGEKAVFVFPIKDPAGRPIAEIARLIGNARTAPLREVKSFRRSLSVSGLPRFLRRLIWWVGLNVSRQRANYFGTFGLSVYSALGAESLHPLSPITYTLNYGVIDAAGMVDVRIIYDHRVTDGATIARALARLEHELNTSIRDELLANASRLAA